MAFTFVEISPDRTLAVSEEFTDNLYRQTLGLSEVPSIPRNSNVVAVFGILSVDTCKTNKTAFELTVLHCAADGGGHISNVRREVVFDPNVLQHYETVASSHMDVSFVNANFPALFAVDIKQRNDAWITIESALNSNHMRVALLGIYVYSLPV